MTANNAMEPTKPILLQPLAADAPLSIEEAISAFTTELEAKNRSQATITAYRCDLSQFAAFLRQNNYTVNNVTQVERADIAEYLSELGQLGQTGITRARK